MTQEQARRRSCGHTEECRADQATMVCTSCWLTETRNALQPMALPETRPGSSITAESLRGSAAKNREALVLHWANHVRPRVAAAQVETSEQTLAKILNHSTEWWLQRSNPVDAIRDGLQ
jgi:hypothetical protein